MNNDNSRQNYDDEIDLRQLFKSLKERSRFIFGFTGVVTLLAIGYVLSLNASPTQYKVETSFFKPSLMSIIKLNQYSLLNETANRNEPIVKNGEIIGYLSSGADNTANIVESIFSKFLTNLNSSVLQKEVFIDGGYEEKLGKVGVPLVSITKNKSTAGFELPHILSTESTNPVIVSEFLVAMLTKADKETINYFINIQKLKIANRLTQLTAKRLELLNEARQSRVNEIVALKDAAALASTLGIIDNNLSLFNTNSNNTNSNFAIQSGTNIRDWYLYGETVLLEMIESLETRASDEPFIPQLLILDSEMSKLKSIRLDLDDVNAVQFYQAKTSEIIPKSKNRLIIALAFIGSFMLSLVLVFLMNALKKEDVTSIQNSK